MSQWTIGKRLIVGFCAVISIAVALGAWASFAIMHIQTAATAVTQDALPGIVAIDKAMLAASMNSALTLNHLASSDPVRIAEIEKEMAANSAATDEGLKAYEATVNTPRDRELFSAIAGPRAEVHRVRAAVLDLSRAQKDKEAFAAYEQNLLPLSVTYAKALQALVDYNRASGKTYAAEIDATVSQSLQFTVVGLAMVVLVGGLFAWYITATTNRSLRTTVGELTSGAEQVSSASGQVASSAQALSQGATEQAASLEETSASMEEMSAMTRQNAQSAERAAGLMADVDSRVRQSDQALGEMVTSMAAIRESSQQVAKIIKTIDEIAFQTNILALNAAVEAARAGEAGMGFAVVADEVRNLAQRSAQAAKDTTGMIEESIDKAERGNVKVQEVSEAIAGIRDGVTQVKSLVDEVSLASRQQTQGIEQVTQAISQMEKVTQGTAATAEESAAASEELNAQADMSMEVVSKLESLVGRVSGKLPLPAARRSHTNASKVIAMTPRRAPARSVADDAPAGDGTFGRF